MKTDNLKIFVEWGGGSFVKPLGKNSLHVNHSPNWIGHFFRQSQPTLQLRLIAGELWSGSRRGGLQDRQRRGSRKPRAQGDEHLGRRLSPGSARRHFKGGRPLLSPLARDFLGRPLCGPIGPIADDEVPVIPHRAKSVEINRHDRGEEYQPLLQPELAVFLRSPGQRIPATQH